MADSIKVRIGIGACLIAAITGLLALDHATGRGFGVIALAVALVAAGLWEFARMAARAVGEPAAGEPVPVPLGGLLVAGVAYMAFKGLSYELHPAAGPLVVPLALTAAYALFFACLRGAPSLTRFRGLCVTCFGFFYVAVLGGFALDVRFLERGPLGEAGFFFVISIAKGTDIFAYFAGKLLGRTKVVPSVSPGKTVAGFVGALVGGVTITGLFVVYSSLGRLIPLPLVPGVGILLALVVIMGDLIESFIKRGAEIKDSANLLPNFGGVLDVIDSVLIAAPAVYYVLRALEEAAA